MGDVDSHRGNDAMIDGQGDEMEVRARSAEWTARLNDGAAGAIGALYCEDAILLPPYHELVHGRASIRDYWAEVIELGPRDARLETIDVDVVRNVACEVGHAFLSIRPNAGAPVELVGKFVVVWRRGEDGIWRLFRDIWNSDIPPGVPASMARHRDPGGLA